jgi:hypothetical protein
MAEVELDGFSGGYLVPFFDKLDGLFQVGRFVQNATKKNLSFRADHGRVALLFQMNGHGILLRYFPLS